jgi:CIC family chloride channel protein
MPEVMMAVARQNGRIRPQVSLVKALASALCIGAGGSVGREGPIVQIGSALASSFGQLAGLPGPKLRILVACGAGAGISAPFSAPITGALFGLELILRQFAGGVFAPSLFAGAMAGMAFGVVADHLFGPAAGAPAARPAQRRQHAIIEMNVECGREGVHVVRHKTIFDTLGLLSRHRHAP